VPALTAGFGIFNSENLEDQAKWGPIAECIRPQGPESAQWSPIAELRELRLDNGGWVS